MSENTPRYRTTLDPLEEAKFKIAFEADANARHMNPNPDDPRQAYDARGRWANEGAGPIGGNSHGPSLYKDPDHPRRFLRMNGRLIDSATGEEATQAGLNELDGVEQFLMTQIPDQKLGGVPTPSDGYRPQSDADVKQWEGILNYLKSAK